VLPTNKKTYIVIKKVSELKNNNNNNNSLIIIVIRECRVKLLFDNAHQSSLIDIYIGTKYKHYFQLPTGVKLLTFILVQITNCHRTATQL